MNPIDDHAHSKPSPAGEGTDRVPEREGEAREGGGKASMRVRDLMSAHVEFIEPEASVQDAAALMGELDVSALPVGTADALKGVVTDRDILYRVVAEGLEPRRTPVSEVATRQIFTCGPDDTLESAMDLMASQNVRRLPVVNEAQRVVGWLTLSDLSRHLLVESKVVQDALAQIART